MNTVLKKLGISFLLLLATNQLISQDRVYTLQECINLAFENNLDVLRSNLDKELADINLRESKMSRLPDLNLGTGYGINWGRSIDPTTNQFEAQRINSANFSGQSSIMIYNGMAITNTIKQSILNLEAGKADLQKVKNDIALSVANLYLNVIFNSELQANAEVQLRSSDDQLERTKKLVDAGSLPITNLLDLQAQQATNEVNLINAQNNYNLAVLQLKQALLIPASDPFEIEIPDINPDQLDAFDANPGEIYSVAEKNQPEIESADLRIRSSNLGVEISKSAYLPQLSFGASFRTNYSSLANQPRDDLNSGTSLEDLPIGFVNVNGQEFDVLRQFEVANATDPDFTFSEQFDENLTQQIGLSLNIPVFNRWRTKSDVQRSMISRRRAEINAKEVRNTLRQTIESAYNNYLAASKSYAASEKQVQALEESYRVIENQYNLGAVNFVDYRVAANNLFVAQSDRTRAKYDYIFKRKVLDFYLGKPLTLY